MAGVYKINILIQTEVDKLETRDAWEVKVSRADVQSRPHPTCGLHLPGTL